MGREKAAVTASKRVESPIRNSSRSALVGAQVAECADTPVRAANNSAVPVAAYGRPGL